MMLEKNKNAILGTIKGYGFSELEPFLRTLGQTSYQGDVVFFYTKINDPTLEKLRERGVILVPLEESGHVHFMCQRFLNYLSYLSDEERHYKNIMLTDVRDVVFQKDPFDFPINESLCCFSESEKMTIGEDKTNSNWIIEAFGQKSFDEIKNKPILCAGTIIGAKEPTINLLILMSSHIKSRDSSHNIDQGIYNYIIHKDLVPEAKIFQNNDGYVLTVNFDKDIRIDKVGVVRNRLGKIPNIIHQYDRYHPLAYLYYNRRLRLKRVWIQTKRLWGYLYGFISFLLKKTFPNLYIKIKNQVKKR